MTAIRGRALIVMGLLGVLGACGAGSQQQATAGGGTPAVAGADGRAVVADAGTRSAEGVVRAVPSSAPLADFPSVDPVTAGAPDGVATGVQPQELTPLRTTHELPVSAILNNLKVDGHVGPTRVLLVGVSDPRLVTALAARGDRIDVFEEDEARFAAAEKAARKQLFRCKSMPTELKYWGEYRRYRGIVPCHDETHAYGAIIVDCMKGEQSLSCAQAFVDPERVGLGASMYVAFSVDHHVSVRSPFSSILAFRTTAGFDALAVPSTLSQRLTDGAAWAMNAQPAPGPEDYTVRRGRFYGCLASKGDARIASFSGEDQPLLLPPQTPIPNRAGIERTSKEAAHWLRGELLVPNDVGPECYALWSFDGSSDLVESKNRPAQRKVTFQALHVDVRPYQLLQTIAAYSPHVEAATAALGRMDLDTAISELDAASAILDRGLGDLAPHTLRGLLVKELAYELSWARAHHRVTDHVRALVRFRPYMDMIAAQRLENALVRAVASFATASMDAAPETAAIRAARFELDALLHRTRASSDPNGPDRVADWLEGRGDYPDYVNDRTGPELRAR